MKGKAHLRGVFAILLMLITVISLVSSSVVYFQFNRQFREKVSDNLSLTGESIVKSLSTDFFARTAQICGQLHVNPTYEVLRTFSPRQFPSEQLKAFERFRMVTLDYSIFLETLLYYPDEAVIMGKSGGILSLRRQQNQALYGDFLSSLPTLSRLKNPRWEVVDAAKLPMVNGAAIALVQEMFFWTHYERPPIAVFLLDANLLLGRLRDYTADGIVISVCSGESGMLATTYDEGEAETFARLVFTPQREWSDGEFTHVRMPIDNTGLSLVLSTSHAYYAQSAKPLLTLFIWLNAAVFLAGIVVSWLLANRLYSPMRQLTDAIADMYSPATGEAAGKNENGFVLSAFDAIYRELTDMGEMVEANLPYLRNALLHDLFNNSQFIGEHTADLLSAARIHLPFERYCVVAVRVSSEDLSALSDIERSVAPYALLSKIENSAEPGAAVHGCNDGGRLLFLLNARESELSGALGRIGAALRAFAEEKRVRTHISHSKALRELSDVSPAAQELEEHFFDNFFDPPVKGAELPNVQPIYAAIVGAAQANNWSGLERALESFVNAVSGCLPPDAFFLLRQLGLTLLPQLPDAKTLTRAENTRILNLLFSPQQVLWSIREYPRALRDAIEETVRNHAQPVREPCELENKVRDYVMAHLSEPISRNGLAEELHFNPSYFSTLFKSQCSVSVSQFIVSIKMEHAVFLLLSTSLSVGEISQKIGFSSPQYFIRKFSDQYGFTPAEFRKRQLS